MKTLIEARTTALSLPLAKRIALHLLHGIARAREREVVHTNFKLDNVFFSTTMTTDDLEAGLRKILRSDMDRRPRMTARCRAVSQPLPMISEDEAMRATYLLADFGCGMYFLLNFFRSQRL